MPPEPTTGGDRMDTRRLLHSGQIVVGQLGLVILVLGWLAGRPLVLLPAVVLAGTVNGLALGRVRGRWLRFAWRTMGRLSDVANLCE